MKVMAIVAGRHNGNSEILAKEALLACQEAGAECKLINPTITLRCAQAVNPVPSRWARSSREMAPTKDVF